MQYVKNIINGCIPDFLKKSPPKDDASKHTIREILEMTGIPLDQLFKLTVTEFADFYNVPIDDLMNIPIMDFVRQLGENEREAFLNIQIKLPNCQDRPIEMPARADDILNQAVKEAIKHFIIGKTILKTYAPESIKPMIANFEEIIEKLVDNAREQDKKNENQAIHEARNIRKTFLAGIKTEDLVGKELVSMIADLNKVANLDDLDDSDSYRPYKRIIISKYSIKILENLNKFIKEPDAEPRSPAAEDRIQPPAQPPAQPFLPTPEQLETMPNKTYCKDGIFISPTIAMLPACDLSGDESALEAHMNRRREALMTGKQETIPEQYKRLDEETRLRFQKGFYNHAKNRILGIEKACGRNPNPEDPAIQKRIAEMATELEKQWISKR